MVSGEEMGLVKGILLMAALLLNSVPAAAGDAALAAPAASAASTADARLDKLFAEDAARELALDPLEGLTRGNKVEIAQFRAIFTEAPARKRLASVEASLAALAGIDRAALTAAHRISYDAFGWTKRDEQALLEPDMRALTDVRPLNHFTGLHTAFPTMMAVGGVMPYATTADYDNALALDAAFPQLLDNAIARMREGMASGVVESQVTVRNMLGQIDAMLALGVDGSPFMTPLKTFPAGVPEADRDRLRQDYARVIGSEVNPAYARLRAFLAESYLPAARTEPGLLAMKGGPALYRRLIADQTTLAISPEEAHNLGLSEVARIHGQMEKVKAELGFAGPLSAFFDHVRSDPRFHPTSAQQLADGYAAIGRAVDAQAGQFFAHMPKTKLVIAPYPDYRAKYEAGGSYEEGTPDGGRPGTFRYNTYDLPGRFLSDMTTLYLHEGEPGHHFQISLALEDPTLPDFQRFNGNNAYVEGWALYSETLGYDMGLYKDPVQHWGTLDNEMLRAMRLVVDTGIHGGDRHGGGWSRDKAIAYMLANSGMSRTDATAEVERYIAYPAQALSYKMGALTIQRLRAKATAALGDKFDIRAFHDQILGSGALPLPVLETKVDAWIASGG